MSPHCTKCGLELAGTERYCPSCGAETDERVRAVADRVTGAPGREARSTATATPGDSQSATESGGRQATGDRGAYLATVAGAIVWLLALVFLVTWQPETATGQPSQHAGYLVVVAFLAWLASLVTMYADLRSVDGDVWDTRPIVWIAGALLLYVVVIPLYVYKRHTLVSRR